MADKLSTYRKKREFAATPEPAGETDAEAPADLRFVVQEHHATRLHWDLRLEHGGVLASWAVPNGIPVTPEENRKAVHTEDHPLEYLDFEGDIPEGNYGAGKMRIWDRGTYRLEKWDERHVIAEFHGERLRGRYALFRAGSDKDWMIHRMDPPEDPDREPMPERIVPMLAKLDVLPPDRESFAWEVKWDGVRAIAYSEPGRLRFESRNLNDITPRYPELRPLNRALSSHGAVLDGEIVAFDREGRPSFQLLQSRMHLTSDSAVRRKAQESPVAYVIFDLLFLDGHSLMDLPYEERRRRLEALELQGPHWQTPAYHRGDGEDLMRAARASGLEGVVAKRLSSAYAPGRRSGDWVKVKNVQRQEVVVAGWLPGEGRRANRIGALLTGLYEGDELRFAGKVGTGFTERELNRLAGLLAPLRRETSPFAGRQPQRGAVFVEPELVAEVEFTEWTSEGLLRHPSYKGLRDDKDPREVVLEEIVTAGGEGAPARVADGEEPLAAALEGAAESAEVTVEGRRLRLTHLDRVLYPAAGIAKRDVVGYYARIAPVLLPHLRGRPLTLRRYPSGVEGASRYEKCCPHNRPDWLPTAPVWSERRGEHLPFCLVDDLPALLWSANLANLELHPTLAIAPGLDRPTFLVFDLDPGEPAGLLDCAEVALLLRDTFTGIGLECLVKTSGGKGVQVYVPLGTDAGYEQTKPFARTLAELLESRLPDRVVARQARKLREGKVLVDWSQNEPHRSTISVYSLRARERPFVSTPVTWSEVEDAVDSGDEQALRFEHHEVLERVDEHGDLFAPVLSLAQRLPGT